MIDDTHEQMPLRQPVEPDPEKKSSGLGCLVKGLIACALIGATLMFAGYYVIFHSAMPARLLVKMINQDPNIQIEGVEGSLKSGFAVKTMRFKDDKGNVNALDDVRLRYRRDGDLVVITEVHVGRGHFYVDRSHEDESAADEEYASEDFATTQSMNLLIKSISINDITVEDVSSGEVFKLDGFHVSDVRLGETFSMGTATLKSSALNLTIKPHGGAKTGNRFTVDGLAKPELHKNLVAPIDLVGTMQADAKGKGQVDLVAFQGKLTIKGDDDEVTVRLNGFNCLDYFQQAPPMEEVELTMQLGKQSATAQGSFRIGDNTFVIDQEIQNPDRGPAEPIVATCKREEVDYRLEISANDFDKGNFSSWVLHTTPSMSHQDAVATLLVGKSYADLSAEEQGKVDEAAASLLDPEVISR